MYNFNVTTSHYWWEWLAKIWFALYYLQDIPNIHTKFVNNRSSSFGDKWQIDDKQTETGTTFFVLLGSRKHKSSHSLDLLVYSRKIQEISTLIIMDNKVLFIPFIDEINW